MFGIRYVTESDKPFWYKLDNYLSEDEFELKIRDKRGYIICDDNSPVGIMRYNLFWDITPFLNLIYLEKGYCGKGFGSKAMKHWEDEMGQLGYTLVMTSTQSNEQAQFFYRKLGYKDSGCLLINQNEPLEIFLTKNL